MSIARSVTPVPWPADEDATLRQMWAAGARLADIAEKLGRTYESVSARRFHLKLETRHRPWTEADDKLLRQLAAEGCGLKPMAARMRRDKTTIRARIEALGIQRVGIASGQRVPQQDIDALRELVARGLSATQIAARLGIPKNTVHSRCHRFGFQLQGKPGAGGYAKAARRRISTLTGQPVKAKVPLVKPKAPCVKDGNKHMPALPAMQPCVAAVSIMDVRLGQCRYVGERPAIIDADTPVFCGAPVAPRADGTPTSWCAAHLARCTARAPAGG